MIHKFTNLTPEYEWHMLGGAEEMARVLLKIGFII